MIWVGLVSGGHVVSHNQPRIRVLIVDDHDMIVAGMRATLENEPDIAVLDEHVRDGRNLIDTVVRLRPDVILLDLMMPHFHLPLGLKRLLALSPQPKIIVVTANDDHAAAHECANAGVGGYVLKEEGVEKVLARVIRDVYRGDTWYSPQALEFLDREAGDREVLSQLQLDVLQLMTDGEEPSEIAAILGKNVKAIYGVQERLREKLRCATREALVAEAIRRRLVELR